MEAHSLLGVVENMTKIWYSILWFLSVNFTLTGIVSTGKKISDSSTTAFAMLGRPVYGTHCKHCNAMLWVRNTRDYCKKRACFFKEHNVSI